MKVKHSVGAGVSVMPSGSRWQYVAMKTKDSNELNIGSKPLRLSLFLSMFLPVMIPNIRFYLGKNRQKLRFVPLRLVSSKSPARSASWPPAAAPAAQRRAAAPSAAARPWPAGASDARPRVTSEGW